MNTNMMVLYMEEMQLGIGGINFWNHVLGAFEHGKSGPNSGAVSGAAAGGPVGGMTGGTAGGAAGAGSTGEKSVLDAIRDRMRKAAL